MKLTTKRFIVSFLSIFFLAAKVGDYLKPIKMGDQYIVGQLSQILEPSVQPYTNVQENVKIDFLAQLEKTQLENETKKVLENFNGKDIGFVSKNTEMIDGLTKEESADFLNQLFNGTTKRGDINLNGKVVVYEILESRLAQSNENTQFLKSDIEQIINNEILLSLLKKLELQYNINTKM